MCSSGKPHLQSNNPNRLFVWSFLDSRVWLIWFSGWRLERVNSKDLTLFLIWKGWAESSCWLDSVESSSSIQVFTVLTNLLLKSDKREARAAKGSFRNITWGIWIWGSPFARICARCIHRPVESPRSPCGGQRPLWCARHGYPSCKIPDTNVIMSKIMKISFINYPCPLF